MKILVAVDGSDNALRAVSYALSQSQQYKQSAEIILLNIQWNLATANVKLFINQETIDTYYREQGIAALQQARAILDSANIAYHYHISVGTPAEAIVQYAREKQVDMIVMGRKGKDSLQELLVGSAVHKVLHLANCPVVLIK